jgi:hypothetical protein
MCYRHVVFISLSLFQYFKLEKPLFMEQDSINIKIIYIKKSNMFFILRIRNSNVLPTCSFYFTFSLSVFQVGKATLYGTR